MAHYDEDYFYPNDFDDIAKDPNGKFNYWKWVVLAVLFMSGVLYLGYKFLL